MALETASYISGLVATNPTGSDPVAQADDHIRLLKSVLKTTFPNITGEMNATQDKLNNTLDKRGDTMTGALVLPGAPTADLHASTKKYVDDLKTYTDGLNASQTTAISALGTASDAKYLRYDTNAQGLTTTQQSNAQANIGINANTFVPSGAVMHFARGSAPSGWLVCDGSAISRTTYASLFAAIGSTFGAGDGSTTFNLPDLRGEFIRGLDNGRGVDSGRTLGSFQDGTGVPNYLTFSGVWPISISVTNGDGTVNTFGDGSSGGGGISGYGGNGTWTTSRLRTRPRNVALLACIKI